MALTKMEFILNENTTNTIVSNYTGLLYKILIYNDNPNQNRFKLYIDGSITLYNKTLEPYETFELKPEIYLQGQTLKLYSEANGLNALFQFLIN